MNSPTSAFEFIETPQSEGELLNLNVQDPLSVLGFPVRIENALTRHGIENIGDLCLSAQTDLFKVRNIGPKTVYLIEKYFPESIRTKILDRDTSPDSSYDKKTKIEPPKRLTPAFPKIHEFKDIVDALLIRLKDDRLRKVLDKRFGLLDGSRHTLEEIGQEYGITRERVRQLEAKSLKRLRHQSVLEKRVLSVHLLDWMLERGGIVDADEADKYFPHDFGLSKYDGSSVLDLLAALNCVQSVRFEDVHLYMPLVESLKFEETIKYVTQLFKKNKKALSKDEVVNKSGLQQLPILIRDSDFRLDAHAFVAKLIKITPFIIEAVSGRKPKYTLYNNPRYFFHNWADIIHEIFKTAGQPLHFTEVADKVNASEVKVFDRILDVRRAHAILISDRRFAHTGIRGTYGLTKWGIRKESTVQLVEECLKQAGFSVHFDQIFYYVSKYKNTSPMNIKAILSNKIKFTRNRNGTYWFNKQSL